MVEHEKFEKVFDESTEKSASIPTVYLGLYNAKQYLPSLKKQIEEQIDQNFTLLIVDNNSTDETISILKTEWTSFFREKLRIYKNSNNIGGVGLFISALYLVKSDWVITLHQDDHYLSNHVSVLSKNIKIMKDRAIIFSDMGSISPEGKAQIPYPRGIWGINFDNRTEILQESIKKQIIPWPASAFKCEVLRKTKSSWESTAFGDNEITIQMLAIGKAHFTNEQTMLYNENQESESHSINLFENRIVGFVSMIRVLTSPILINFYSELDYQDRLEFYIKMQYSIQNYLVDRIFSDVAYYYIINFILVESDHSDLAASNIMQQIYDELGLGNNSRRLRNFENISNSAETILKKSMKIEKVNNLLNYYKNDQDLISQIDTKSSLKFHLYQKVMFFLSYKNQKRVTIIAKKLGMYK
jgi:glycosyltransferase involved in cell wall biosynthesis